MSAATASVERVVVRGAGGRQVQIRRLGVGPPVVLLHESPRSSAALMPLAARLATRFTVLALDTPGYGLSDPLPIERPEIADYAVALAETLDLIGLDKVPLYGTHTGAEIVMAFADQFPERTAVAVLDGYPLFTEIEQEEHLAGYLPPLRPDWSGAHVAWLWSRVRDQFTYFPWNRPGRASRLQRSPPPLEVMQAVVDDFLAAGDGYRVGYAAAFRYDAGPPLARAKAPVVLAAREDDLLYGHLDRVGALSPTVSVERLSADRDRWAEKIAEAFERHLPNGQVAMPVLDQAGSDRRFVQVNGLSIHARVFGDPAAEPVLLLHDLPGGSAQMADVGQRLADERLSVAVDLPGCGPSDALRETPTVEELTRILAATARRLTDRPWSVVAFGASMGLASALARANDLTVDRLILVDPAIPAHDPEQLSAALPDLRPRWDGGHLAAAWHLARDDMTYKPWYRRVIDCARRLELDADTGAVQRRFADIVHGGRAGIALTRACLAHDAVDDIAAAAARVSLIAHDGDPHRRALAALADTGGINLTACPPHAHEIAGAIADRLRAGQR